MADHTYAVEEIVGSSADGQDAAIGNAVAYARAKYGDSLRWFVVKETRGHLRDGQIAHFQVTLTIGRST